jgi:hypothetical protein
MRYLHLAILASTLTLTPHSIEALVVLMLIYSVTFYYLCGKLLLGLVESNVKTDGLHESIQSVVLFITSMFTLYLMEYEYVAIFILPFVVLNIVTTIMSGLVISGYITVEYEEDEEDI